MNNSYQAALLDREGVLIKLPKFSLEEASLDFITSKDQLELIEGSIEGIKLLNRKDIKVIIITNMPQIGKGLITESEANEINSQFTKLFQKQGARIDAIYYCPHHPTHGIGKYKTECSCRKPKAGLLLQAQKDFNLDLEKSVMVGDRTSDIKAGIAAGCKTILVKTGYGGQDNFKDASADKIVENILEAAKIIAGDIIR